MINLISFRYQEVYKWCDQPFRGKYINLITTYIGYGINSRNKYWKHDICSVHGGPILSIINYAEPVPHVTNYIAINVFMPYTYGNVSGAHN